MFRMLRMMLYVQLHVFLDLCVLPRLCHFAKQGNGTSSRGLIPVLGPRRLEQELLEFRLRIIAYCEVQRLGRDCSNLLSVMSQALETYAGEAMAEQRADESCCTPSGIGERQREDSDDDTHGGDEAVDALQRRQAARG